MMMSSISNIDTGGGSCTTFHRSATAQDEEDSHQLRRIARQNTRTQQDQEQQQYMHQNSVSSNASELKTNQRKQKEKDEKKMKRYLIKIFEKMQENNASMQSTDSPDPLQPSEHSNSGQEHSLSKKGENQSSLSDMINSQLKNGRSRGNGGNNGIVVNEVQERNMNNSIGGGAGATKSQAARKMQFYTSNNFYPQKMQMQQMNMKPTRSGIQKERTAATNNLPSKYENTENYIKEESSDENQGITEAEQEDDEENDYNMNQVANESGVLHRRRKLKKTGCQPNHNSQIITENTSTTSPGNISNPRHIYQNNPMINTASHFNTGGGYLGALDRSKLSKLKYSENSYHDISGGDRSATNRTPLLEHYQNQSVNCMSRNHHSNAATSVPRPTIASELKLLKESRGSPQPSFIDDGKGTSHQFLHNNNLTHYMWNKGGEKLISEQSQESNRGAGGGSRVRREYNIHDGTSGGVRPITRSNQRRPVSRQVNPLNDNSGITTQKMLVQQQMRNTHFGDGGFGFGSRLKGDLSLDSERQISRKRGTKVHNVQGNNQSNISEVGEPSQQRSNGGVATIINQVGSQQLNRSITFNHSNQHAKQTVQNYNEQVSTQESSGSHFYQGNNFLNKSIESNSS